MIEDIDKSHYKGYNPNKRRISMHRIIEVKPLSGYKVWLKFSDGIEGTVDLSDVVGKGVFKSLKDKEQFKAVFIDQESHTIAWPGNIDLCPDSLYAEICGTEILQKSSNA